MTAERISYRRSPPLSLLYAGSGSASVLMEGCYLDELLNCGMFSYVENLMLFTHVQNDSYCHLCQQQPPKDFLYRRRLRAASHFRGWKPPKPTQCGGKKKTIEIICFWKIVGWESCGCLKSFVVQDIQACRRAIWIPSPSLREQRGPTFFFFFFFIAKVWITARVLPVTTHHYTVFSFLIFHSRFHLCSINFSPHSSPSRLKPLLPSVHIFIYLSNCRYDILRATVITIALSGS